MNKKLLPKIIIGFSILLLIFEILRLDFDNIGQSFTQNFLKLLMPILLIVSMLITVRGIEKKNN